VGDGPPEMKGSADQRLQCFDALGGGFETVSVGKVEVLVAVSHGDQGLPWRPKGVKQKGAIRPAAPRALRARPGGCRVRTPPGDRKRTGSAPGQSPHRPRG